MITKGKCFDLYSKSLNLFFKEVYGDQSGDFVCGYWGFKGITPLMGRHVFYVTNTFHNSTLSKELLGKL